MRHTRTAIAACLLAATLAACAPQPDKPAGIDIPTASPTPSPSATTSAPTKSQKLQDWFDGGGQAQLDKITGDLSKVTSGLAAADMDKLTTSCAKLTADVETVQGGEPMPDAQAASEWKLAMDHLRSAAAHCTNGAISQDPSEIDQMSAELKIGTNHVSTMNDRLSAIRNSG